MIYPFVMKNWKTVREIYADIQNDTTLMNRDWELWKPMFVLAKFFDNTLFQRIEDLAIKNTTQNQYTDSELLEIVLVETLFSLVDHGGYYSLAEIKTEMRTLLLDDEKFTPKKLGSLLRRLGFLKFRRVGPGYEYFLEVEKVRDLARQLGVSEHSELSERLTEQGTQTIVTETEPREATECQGE
jgi:hypothetical protein